MTINPDLLQRALVARIEELERENEACYKAMSEAGTILFCSDVPTLNRFHNADTIVRASMITEEMRRLGIGQNRGNNGHTE